MIIMIIVMVIRITMIKMEQASNEFSKSNLILSLFRRHFKVNGNCDFFPWCFPIRKMDSNEKKITSCWKNVFSKLNQDNQLFLFSLMIKFSFNADYRLTAYLLKLCEARPQWMLILRTISLLSSFGFIYSFIYSMCSISFSSKNRFYRDQSLPLTYCCHQHLVVYSITCICTNKFMCISLDMHIYHIDR